MTSEAASLAIWGISFDPRGFLIQATTQQLEQVARALVAPGKGILAADESTGTIQKRFDAVGVESHRGEPPRLSRAALHDAGVPASSSAASSCYDETLRQASAGRHAFRQGARRPGHHPRHQGRRRRETSGVRPGRDVTEGLDGLRERLRSTASSARALQVARGDRPSATGCPRAYVIDVNAHALARYAALCQEAGLVPIVEPEVLMDGDPRRIERCDEVTATTLREVFGELAMPARRARRHAAQAQHGRSRARASAQADHRRRRRGHRALLCAHRARGGTGHRVPLRRQSEEEATAHLNAMNGWGRIPWELSFSYGRALQDPR